tara:strand:+ start:663 stop:1088 length:426 start_codon:yes stop_codon:yes gene_type:complete
MKNYIMISLILLLFNCQMNDKYTDQSDIISEKKMIDIIYDMALINVSKGINKRILENNGMKPQSYILKKYKIDSMLFVRSNNFYSKDLDKYLNIYDQVLKKLEKNRQLINDSIEKINLEVQQKNKLNNKFKSEIKLTKPNN